MLSSRRPSVDRTMSARFGSATSDESPRVSIRPSLRSVSSFLRRKSVSTSPSKKQHSTGGKLSTIEATCCTSSPPQHLGSTFRRKSLSVDSPRKLRRQLSADEVHTRGLWPSTKKSGVSPTPRKGTLQDHLNDDTYQTLLENKKKIADDELPTLSTAKHESSSFSSSAASEEEGGARGRSSSKENRPIRRNYLGKLLMERSSKTTHHRRQSMQTSRSDAILDTQLSMDNNNSLEKRKSDFGMESPVKRFRSPVPRKSRSPVLRTSKSLVLRTQSKSPVQRRSRSPARRRGSPASTRSVSPREVGIKLVKSNRQKPSPAKERNGGSMGSLISMGLNSLFGRKSFAGVAVTSTKSVPSATTPSTAIGSPAKVTRAAAEWPARGTLTASERQHRLRMAHNYFIQWRFLNARAAAATTIKCATAENILMSAWYGLSDLNIVVAQKRLHLAKLKLSFKLVTLLFPQTKVLETWEKREKQHMVALSSTKDSFHAAVCRLPLTNRAKADPQILSILLRQAANIAAANESHIATCNSTTQGIVALLIELAEVVAREKPLLEECLELLEFVSRLQFQEESLRSHLIQLKL